MTEQRMIRVTKEQLENISEYFDSDVSIFDQIFEMFSCFDGEVTEYDYRLKRFDGLEPAPPKDWQERLHKVAELTQYISETGDGTEAGFNSIDVAISRLKDVATLKQQIKELEDANRYLARSNGKLILELRKMQEHNLE